jgi:predicted MFS family arabinose efflux permease
MYAISVLFTAGLPSVPPSLRDRSVTFLSDFAGGFRYIRSDHLVLGLLLLGTIPMIFAMPYQTLMPVFAADVWHVGPKGLGVLQAMSGVGGLAGALLTANLDRSRRKGAIMLFSAVGSGVFLIAFSMSSFSVALPMLAMVGLTSMVFTTVNNTVITSIVPDNMRGRVMSVAMMTFGLKPLGAVPASLAAEAIGTPAVVTIGGILLIASVAIAYSAFPRLRTLDGAIQIQRADRDREAADMQAAAAAGGG